MQVCEKLGDLDHKPTKLTGNAAYWAKRMPRTYAQNAEVFRAEQAQAVKKAEENLIRLAAKKLPPPAPPPVFPEREKERERIKWQVEQLHHDVRAIIGSGEAKSIREIVMVTAYVLEVLPVQVMSRNRRHRIVLAKAVVSVIASAMGYSASEIGRQMGYSDHTTVLHHIKNLSKQEPVKFWVRKVARMVHLNLEGDL